MLINPVFNFKIQKTSTNSISYRCKISLLNEQDVFVSFSGKKESKNNNTLSAIFSILMLLSPLKADTTENKKADNNCSLKSNLIENITLTVEDKRFLHEKLDALHCKGKYDETYPIEKNELLTRTQEIDKSIEKYNMEQGVPSPKITILGINTIARAVIDKATHMTYFYDNDGKFVEKFPNATGVEAKETSTECGIRYVTRIEKFPYKNAQRPKMIKTPNAFGPYTAMLFMVNPKNGQTEDNGQYIHGTNIPSSIGKSASHGCIRHNNKIAKQFPLIFKKGDFINIINSGKSNKKKL